MIVNSNAFVFSTCLLVVVSRYGCTCEYFICFSLFILHKYLIWKIFPELYYIFRGVLSILHLFQFICFYHWEDPQTKFVFQFAKIFPSFNPLGNSNKLRGRYFKHEYHKLKARGYPFFVTHVSIITWDYLNQYLNHIILQILSYFAKVR